MNTRTLRTAVLGSTIAGMLAGGSTARADISSDAYFLYCLNKTLDSEIFIRMGGNAIAIRDQETADIKRKKIEYLDKHSDELSITGEASFAGETAVARVPQSGYTGTVTFSMYSSFFDVFIDPVSVGIAGVRYDIVANPFEPDVFTPIGLSTDATSSFAVTWTTFSEYESVLRATPLDAAGNVMNFYGSDGVSRTSEGYVTIIEPVPAPGSAALAGLGGLLAIRRRRR